MLVTEASVLKINLQGTTPARYVYVISIQVSFVKASHISQVISAYLTDNLLTPTSTLLFLELIGAILFLSLFFLTETLTSFYLIF